VPEDLSRGELIALVKAMAATNTALQTTVEALTATLKELRAEIAALRAQLATTSKNSSKPPSSDGLAKPAPRSLRRKGGRPGGQDGHPGQTLRQVTTPDVIVRHEPVCCAGCGGPSAQAVEVGTERRQVFDLPPTAVQVTEHQLITRACRCGTRTTGLAPRGVNAPVSYGPRVSAALVYLYQGQFLSKARTAQAMSDLLGVPVSQGTVATVTARAAAALTVAGGFTDTVRAQLRAAGLIHLDETGLRVAGRLHWLHSAGTTALTLLHVHRRRGREAIEAFAVLPGFTGIAVHDAWAPYDTYTTPRHVLCGAHLLRELSAVIDHHQLGAAQQGSTSPAGSWCWAQQALESLLAIKTLTDTANSTGSNPHPASLSRHRTRLRHAARIGADPTTHPDPSRLGNKHQALARRIRDRETNYLAFTTNPTIPFDNNLAERDIRMVKIRQKISGCLRTLTGAQHFAAIRSYTATAGKNNINIYQALVQLAEGNAWLPQPT
jgi:transposase